MYLGLDNLQKFCRCVEIAGRGHDIRESGRKKQSRHALRVNLQVEIADSEAHRHSDHANQPRETVPLRSHHLPLLGNP